MAYTTPLFGTGYEMGAIPLTSSYLTRGAINSVAAYVKTGTYSLDTTSQGWPNHAWAKYAVPVETSSIYVSCHHYPTGVAFSSLGVVLDSGEVVELRKDVTAHTYDLYIDGSLIESGSIAVPDNQFQHIQAYFNIATSGGVTSKIDGVTDIEYSGDTQPGTGNIIEYVQQYQLASGSWVTSYWDDLSFGTGDWGEDIRFDGIVPNGDDAVQWTPSTGADNYALVDERPPSTVDYVSTGSPGLEDLYDLADWSGTAKTPQFVMAWAYAKKDVAGDIQLQLFVDSNSSESSGSPLDLTTTDAYYSHLAATDPNGSIAWLDNAIDALKIGIRSV